MEEHEIIQHIENQCIMAKKIILDEIEQHRSNRNTDMFIGFLKHQSEKSIDQYKHCLLEKFLLKKNE